MATVYRIHAPWTGDVQQVTIYTDRSRACRVNRVGGATEQIARQEAARLMAAVRAERRWWWRLRCADDSWLVS